MKKNGSFRFRKLIVLGIALLSFVTYTNAADIHITSTPGSPVTTGFSCDNLIIHSGATYTCAGDITITVWGKIIVQDDASLVLTGSTQMTVFVGDRIDVESDYPNYLSSPAQGGILNASKVKFQALHNTGWTGIFVWGMRDGGIHRSQDKSAKATFNDCIITEAAAGVANYRNQNGALGLDHPTVGAGGVIRANNTLFLNNAIGVDLGGQTYKNINTGFRMINDRCEFSVCDFICNADPIVNIGDVNMFVRLRDIEGTKFRGCTFDDQTHQHMGGAIKARDAGFHVTDYCSGGVSPSWYGSLCFGGTLTRSLFTGFSSGRIVIEGTSGGIHTLSVEHAEFVDNIYNITLINYPMPMIVGNTITATGSVINSISMPKFAGIVLENCPMAICEDNNISATSYTGWSQDPNTSRAAVGIAVINGGGLIRDVYNNGITNMDFALQSIGENRVKVNQLYKGLKFICNSMSSGNSQSHDILVAKTGFPFNTGVLTLNTGIDGLQNNATSGVAKPAGNVFDVKDIEPANKNFFSVHENGSDYTTTYLASSASSEYPTYNNLSGGVSTFGTPSCQTRIPYHSQTPTYTTLASNIPTIPTIGTVSEAGMHGALDDYGVYMHNNIRDYMYVDTLLPDTLGTPLDTLEMILDNAGYFYGYKLLLAQVLLTQGRHQDAIDAVDAIGLNFTLNEEEINMMADIKKVYELAKDLYDNDYDWGSADVGLKSSVAAIATNQTIAGAMARTYMVMYEGGDYEPELIRTMVQPEITSVSPNPATRETGVDIDYEARSAVSPQITITPIEGGTPDLHNISVATSSLNVPLDEYTPGTYVVKLISNSVVVDEAELVVNRIPFNANAGDDQVIDLGSTATLEAEDVGETADYNWYDAEDNLLYTGRVYMFNPGVTATYRLEVVAASDNFTDEDYVQVAVRPFFITTVAPNPASTSVDVSYQTTGATTASIVITPFGGGTPDVHPITPGQSTYTVNLSGYTSGNYVITLKCDGNVEDEEALVVVAP